MTTVDLQAARARKQAPSYAFTFEPSSNGNGKPKLKLADIPAPDDIAGHCSWLTGTFNLDPKHPIIAGAHQGLRGTAGRVVLKRRGVDSIRFEPRSRINTPGKLTEDLDCLKQSTDKITPSFTAEHCREIRTSSGCCAARPRQ